MMLVDFTTYMADDILTKVDRASMGVSLEVRCPLLDPRVIELAWSLPSSMRMGPKGGKHILQNLLARHVPRALFERPKQGFNIPIEEWLRGPLRDWAEALLDEHRLHQEGYLRPRAGAADLAGPSVRPAATDLPGLEPPDLPGLARDLDQGRSCRAHRRRSMMSADR